MLALVSTTPECARRPQCADVGPERLGVGGHDRQALVWRACGSLASVLSGEDAPCSRQCSSESSAPLPLGDMPHKPSRFPAQPGPGGSPLARPCSPCSLRAATKPPCRSWRAPSLAARAMALTLQFTLGAAGLGGSSPWPGLGSGACAGALPGHAGVRTRLSGLLTWSAPGSELGPQPRAPPTRAPCLVLLGLPLGACAGTPHSLDTTRVHGLPALQHASRMPCSPAPARTAQAALSEGRQLRLVTDVSIVSIFICA